jgi:hypothetical protein
MNSMRKLALALTLALVPFAGFAQGTGKADKVETPKITVKSKGDDVRTVLATIFEQGKKQYVLPVNFRFALFLSLEDADFEKALSIVCKQTGLEYVIEEDVYHVRVASKKPAEKTTEPIKVEAKEEDEKEHDAKVVPTPPKPEPKKGILSPHVLARKLTTRLNKADIRDVFAAMSDQTKVPIEVAADVPAYKLDAFLIKTSLKYALDRITSATGLEYRFTDRGTIAIIKKTEAAE